MEIQLTKNWRYAGRIIKKGCVINVTDKDTLKFLKENEYIYKEEKKKKEKKGKEVDADKNN